MIRRLREERALSQNALADLADVGRTYIGSVDRGERNPSFENLQQILSALRVTWSEFGQALDEEPALRLSRTSVATHSGRGSKRSRARR